MHSKSRENMVKCYVIYENCYHYNNINVKNQIGMHISAPVWSHFKYYMRIIYNIHSMYLVQ